MTYLIKIKPAYLLAIALCALLISCESPADVEADRNVIREYDPSLTGERLRIDGAQNLNIGNYHVDTNSVVYTIKITNISGESYTLDSLKFIGNLIPSNSNSYYLEYPEMPYRMSTSGSGSTFNINIIKNEPTKIQELAGAKEIPFIIYGSIDSLEFNFAYHLPPVVFEYSKKRETVLNANIPVRISIYNFGINSIWLSSPRITTEAPQLSLMENQVFPMRIDPIGAKNITYLFRPNTVGIEQYTIEMPLNISHPNVPDKIELQFDVKSQ